MTADPVVVARTPLRLSLGGGGTDLPFYRRRYGGDVLSVAISPRVTVVGRGGRLDGRVRFGYEQVETADDARRLTDPFVREALDLVGLRTSCELWSLGAVPAGTGLGSSGAFAVSLLAVVNALAGRAISRAELIEQACELEIERLGRPVGKHDQYICGLGGLRRLVISPSGAVEVTAVAVAPSTLDEVLRRLVLVYTGARRDSTAALSPGAVDVAARVAQLHSIRQIGDRMRQALMAGEWEHVPHLLREHWAVKREQSANQVWDPLCAAATEAGAVACKLVGAGDGGFVLFWAEPSRQADVVAAASAFGARRLPFTFDTAGTSLTRIESHAAEMAL